MSNTQIKAEDLLSVAGVKVASVMSGIRYQNRLDLVVMELAPGTTVAGVFTQNAFCAAPVQLARRHLASSGGAVRYLLVNTGNANAGTGQKGLDDAAACCGFVARQAGVAPEQVLPFSTGVIGENLPVAKVEAGVPAALGALGDDWLQAARGIMTTDTRPKARSVQVNCGGQPVVITGIAKGAGMIKPNMATLLSFVFTDALIEQSLLQSLLASVVDQSFNRITVDGDTSPMTAVSWLPLARAACASSVTTRPCSRPLRTPCRHWCANWPRTSSAMPKGRRNSSPSTCRAEVMYRSA